MRFISSITKSILVATVVLFSRSAAHGESGWTTLAKGASAHSASNSNSDKGVKAAGTAVAQGTFYLIASTCSGTPDAFEALFYVRQSGSRFTVSDSAGLRLSGRGSRSGFKVSARRLDRRNGVSVTHSISAGPVLYDYTANFRYTATLRRLSDGAGCQAVFEGNMSINR
jgi:hypothetical protein